MLSDTIIQVVTMDLLLQCLDTGCFIVLYSYHVNNCVLCVLNKECIACQIVVLPSLCYFKSLSFKCMEEK